MGGFLRQSTTTTIKLGPFTGTDGITPYTAGGFTVKLAKAGGSLAARHDATAITHDADGDYFVELDATDTNTVGSLKVEVPGVAGSYLPVWQEYTVLPAAIYDAVIAGTVPTLSGVAADLPSMIVQVWRKLFKKVVKDKASLTIKTYADDGTTVLSTQAYTDDSTGNESLGAAT